MLGFRGDVFSCSFDLAHFDEDVAIFDRDGSDAVLQEICAADSGAKPENIRILQHREDGGSFVHKENLFELGQFHAVYFQVVAQVGIIIIRFSDDREVLKLPYVNHFALIKGTVFPDIYEPSIVKHGVVF